MVAMNGILLVDKPVGISSFGVVAKVRGIWRNELREQGVSIKKAKIGHTGTLDPMASGLMILVLGSYTKRAQEFSKLDKVYEAELTLGSNSTTDDLEGELAAVSDRQPTADEVKQVAVSLVGEIEQVPPIYSAIKIDGQRAYKLARKGHEVAMQPRQVTIFSIDNLEYDYPRLRFTVHVSSGTYIRSLARDIGKKLNTGAYLSALRRTKVGEFELDSSLKLQSLNLQSIIDLLRTLP